MKEPAASNKKGARFKNENLRQQAGANYSPSFASSSVAGSSSAADSSSAAGFSSATGSGLDFVLGAGEPRGMTKEAYQRAVVVEQELYLRRVRCNDKCIEGTVEKQLEKMIAADNKNYVAKTSLKVMRSARGFGRDGAGKSIGVW